MKKVNILLIFFVLLSSCQRTYTYTVESTASYSHGSKTEIIKASSDSDAYTEAINKFAIGQEVARQMNKSTMTTSGGPVSFELKEGGRNVLLSLPSDVKERILKTVNSSVQNIATKDDLFAKPLQNTSGSSLFDTIGLYMSPVRVLNSRLVKKDYSSYRDINISFKNVSSKTISAIRFRWYILNAFGELADQGFGNGMDDDKLRAGHSNSTQWNVLSRDAKKIILAWPAEVVFEDGTKWKLTRDL